MSLGSTIRELRKEKGISTRIMAYQINVDHTYVSKIENGKAIPSEEVLYRLADYFHCDKDGLMLLANRLPNDVREISLTRQKEAIALLRTHFRK